MYLDKKIYQFRILKRNYKNGALKSVYVSIDGSSMSMALYYGITDLQDDEVFCPGSWVKQTVKNNIDFRQRAFAPTQSKTIPLPELKKIKNLKEPKTYCNISRNNKQKKELEKLKEQERHFTRPLLDKVFKESKNLTKKNNNAVLSKPRPRPKELDFIKGWTEEGSRDLQERLKSDRYQEEKEKLRQEALQLLEVNHQKEV